jgi:hypothetical protein
MAVYRRRRKDIGEDGWGVQAGTCENGVVMGGVGGAGVDG